MTRRPIVDATNLVAVMIRRLDPEFWHGRRDAVGHKINVHYQDGTYAATMNWETRDWCSYEFLDRVNDALEANALPFVAEYMGDRELALEDV